MKILQAVRSDNSGLPIETTMPTAATSMAQENVPPPPFPCDGCGKIFPICQAEGDCPKCIKLVSFTIDSADYIQLRVSSKLRNIRACQVEWCTNSYGPEMASVPPVWGYSTQLSTCTWHQDKHRLVDPMPVWSKLPLIKVLPFLLCAVTLLTCYLINSTATWILRPIIYYKSTSTRSTAPRPECTY